MFLWIVLAAVLAIAGQGWAAEQAAEGGASFYLKEYPAMKSSQCPSCHEPVFDTLREQGGKHQLVCRNCHVRFHNFRPGATAVERFPSCTMCHPAAHGGVLPLCGNCHGNAHAPTGIVAGEELAMYCTLCHGGAASAMAGSHGELSCIWCHEGEHGGRPECSACHGVEHATFEKNSSCTPCHPHHAPLPVILAAGTGNELCAACHEDLLASLGGSKKAHAELECIDCHEGRHGGASPCGECHDPAPHNLERLKAFEGCLSCHGDPHTLLLP